MSDSSVVNIADAAASHHPQAGWSVDFESRDAPLTTRASRPLPRVGLEVSIVHLGVRTPAVVEQVLDGGRTLVAGGETFELSRLTAHYVRAGDPYYGVRLALSRVG